MLEYPMLTLLVIAPLAEKVQQAERQRRAVEAITEVRGQRVWYDYERDLSRGMAEPPARTWLRKLLGEHFFSNVVAVNLIRPVGDAALGHVCALSDLESLFVRDKQFTDEGLRHLTGLTGLTELHLFNTHVTEEGINELRKALPHCWIYWRLGEILPPPTTPKTNHDQN